MGKPAKNEQKTVPTAFAVGDKILCACNNKPCAGICREKNLNRKRADKSACPAAFVPQKPRVKRERRRYEED